ncbi:hypothetical protein [Pseudonocardia alni]|uniref:hypothetical protein n=1 Tax=Pseudonocardia alni TaxID=33907 RepID=UPI00280A5729|nr:hypothetical protein [Pseudonocardia alni]
MNTGQDADVPKVVEACLEIYGATMAGRQPRVGELRRLGVFADLLIVPNTGWRVDGLARLQILCAELLDCFVADGLRSTSFSKVDVRHLLGRWTGVDTSPMSISGARTTLAVDGGTPPSETLVRKWRTELYVSPPVLELVRDRLARTGEIPLPSTTGVGDLLVWESDPAAWPPTQYWIQLREILLARTDLPRGLRDQLRIFEDQLLLAARDRAAQRADEYLMDAVTPHPEPDLGGYILAPEHAWRWFRQKALLQWNVNYRIAPPRTVEVPVTVEGNEKFVMPYRRRAAAAMQLALGRLVTQPAEVNGLLRHLYGADERMRQTVRSMSMVEDLFLVDRSFGRPIAMEGTGDMPLLRADAPDDLETRIHDLTKEASLLRDRLSRQGAALALAEIYCTERAGISLEPSVDPALLLELDLADHSVDWDLVSLSTSNEGRLLRSRFRQAVRMPVNTSFSRNAGLRLHRHRSEMVAATKRRDWRTAIEVGNMAWSEAGNLVEVGKLTGVYALECQQQIALGLAGVWVKQAEDCLLAVDQAHLAMPYQRYLTEALVWSRRANDMLADLVVIGLPAKRGEDGRIGYVRWTAHTPTLLMRAQLAALTAAASGLCRRDDLVDPSAPAAVGLDEADRLYLQMITNKYAGPGLTVQLAFWTALLHEDLRLPVAAPGSVSKRIEQLDLLHCTPDAPQQSVQLDFADVTVALRRHGYNANILGKLHKGTRVHEYLSNVHPGFACWSTGWRAAGGT